MGQARAVVDARFDEYLESLEGMDEVGDWLAEWRNPLLAFCKCLTGFCTFMLFTADVTVSTHTLYQRYQRVMYDRVHTYFSDADVAANVLPTYPRLRKSAVYLSFRRSSSSIFGGVGSDSMVASPLFTVDFDRIVSVVPANAEGKSLIAWMGALHATGARGDSLARVTPSMVKRVGAERYEVTYPVTKVNAHHHRQAVVILSGLAGQALGDLRKAVRSGAYVPNDENNAFGARSPESMTMRLYKHAARAGYPHQHFTNHSFRVGLVSSLLLEAALNRTPLSTALQNSRVVGHWASQSNAIDRYIRPVVNWALNNEDLLDRQFAGLTADDLHVPFLDPEHLTEDNRLPPPSRYDYKALSAIYTRQYVARLQTVYDAVANDANRNAEPAVGRWNKLARIGASVVRDRHAHPSVRETHDAMVAAPNGLDAHDSAATLAQCLLSLGRLRPERVPLDEETGRHVFIRVSEAEQFLRPLAPPRNARSPKRKSMVAHDRSTSFVLLRQHYAHRTRERSAPKVTVGGTTYDLCSLSPEQCQLLDEVRHNADVDLPEFLAAANHQMGEE